MTIEEAKNNLISTLDSLNKDKLSLFELRTYADILKTVSEIQTKNYTEVISEMFSQTGGFAAKAPTVLDLK